MSEDAYNVYLKETKELSKDRKREIRSKNSTYKLKIEKLKKLNDELARQIANLTDSRMIKEQNEKIALNYDEIEHLEDQIKENEEKLSRGHNGMKPYSPQEFAQIMHDTKNYFEKASVVRKDLIIREIFSNFCFGEEKIVSFSVKEPFATLLGVKPTTSISLGGGWEIRTPAPGRPSLTI